MYCSKPAHGRQGRLPEVPPQRHGSATLTADISWHLGDSDAYNGPTRDHGLVTFAPMIVIADDALSIDDAMAQLARHPTKTV